MRDRESVKDRMRETHSHEVREILRKIERKKEGEKERDWKIKIERKETRLGNLSGERL